MDEQSAEVWGGKRYRERKGERKHVMTLEKTKDDPISIYI